MRKLAGAGVVMVAVLALAACGGSSSKTSASGSTKTTVGSGTTASGSGTTAGSSGNSSSSSSANTQACSLVTQDQATTLFGHPAQTKAPAGAGISASQCLWGADTNPGTMGDTIYLLQVHVYDGEQFYGEKVYSGAEHLDGIGDKAFVGKLGNMVTVQFVKNGKTVSIAYSANSIGDGAKVDPTSQKAEVIALAKTAAGRM